MEDRYEVLADELREQVTTGVCTVDVKRRDIYVRAHEHDADNALTVAHDHGFTPNGVIVVGDDHVGFRLKPRTESEVDR